MFKKILDPNIPFKPASFPFHYAWVIVAVSILGVVGSSPGQTIGVSVFTDSLLNVTKIGRVNMSITYFCGTFFSAFLMKWTGRLYDQYGGRLIMIISCAGLGLSLFQFSQLHNIVELLGQSVIPVAILMALSFFFLRLTGQGMLTLTSKNLIGKWFEQKRGLASAFSGVAISMGFSWIPVFFSILIDQYGWQQAYLILAVIVGLGILFVGWAFYRNSPESCDLSIDAGIKIDPVKEKQARPSHTLSEAKKRLAFWSICICLSLQGMMITGFTFHIEDIGKMANMSRNDVVFIFVPMALISAPTGVITGWLADFVKVKYIIITMLISEIIAFIGVAYFGSTIGFWSACSGFACASGCFATLSNIGLPHYFGRQFLGELSGYLMFCLVLTSSVGPLMLALSKHLTGSYSAIFLLLIAGPLITLICALKIKE